MPALDDAEVLTYLVKYRPIRISLSIQKRDVDDLSTIVETNQTNVVISGLDQRFAYAVSVAASNGGGPGNHSEEVEIGCELQHCRFLGNGQCHTNLICVGRSKPGL